MRHSPTAVNPWAPMRYRLSDVAALLRTPIRRIRVLSAACHSEWPLLAKPAVLHRRTLGRSARIVAAIGPFGKTTTARAILVVFGGHAQSIANDKCKGL